MKLIFGAAVLILLFSLPASAQGAFGNYGSVGGGPSLNSGSSLNNQGGWRGPGTRTVASAPVAEFHMSVINGSDDYIPSTFVKFDDAVAQGRVLLAQKPKTLAEIAAEYRATKKPKADVAFVQDNSGNAVVKKQ